VDGILGHSLLLSQAFWWESLRGWDFSRPQLVVVSGLFGGNPFVNGIFLGHNLLLSQAFFFTVELRLSRGLSLQLFLFHDGISTITKPFSRIFFLFTMEFRLSRSLSHEFFSFSRWNLGYHEAFLTNFSLFSRWNLGYHEAFLTNFSLFSRWNFGYHEAFLTNFSLFSRWNFGYHEAFLTN
jgi:hypothetical protein